MTKKNSTVFSPEDKLARKVDPKTCELLSDNINITETDAMLEAGAIVDDYDPLGVSDTAYELTSSKDTRLLLIESMFEKQRIGEDDDYEYWSFYLFNLKIMASFLAAASPLAFYATTVMLVSTFIQPAFRGYIYAGW
jgi:hypothetical protein